MKYRIVKYYPRAHEVEAASLDLAIKMVELGRELRGTNCYTEIWKMKNDSDGEQVKLFDSHGYELEPVKSPAKPTATMSFR